MYETLLYSVSDAVAEIRFNRPHRLNAVIDTLYTELQDALDRAEADPGVRVLVLTGEGRAFCVGADLKAHAEGTRTPFQRREYLRGEQQVCKRLLTSDKPVVAAVNGYALGAGAEMALACDFLVMAESAQWGLPEISLGTFLGGGLTRLLPQRVGMGRARELIYFGRRVSGPEAVQMGLADRCWPDDHFREEVRRFAAELAEKAPISMKLAKECLYRGSERSLEDTLIAELEGMMFCTTTRDWQEGIRAFAEKRTPRYTGD